MTSDTEKRRLPPLGIIVKSLESVRAMLYLVLAPAVAGGGVSVFAETLIMAAVIGSIIVGSVMLGLVRWFRFVYWFEDGQFRVEQGALIRKKTYIPLDKIQATDITIGVVQRVLGLVQLEIKTASAGSQAKLSALTRADAERIKARLRQGAGDSPVAEAQLERTYRLTMKQLLLAGATSGRLGVVLGGLAWLFSQFDDLIFEKIATSFDFDLDPERVLDTDPLLIAAVVVAGFGISWLGAVAWELLTYGGFSAGRRGRDVVIQRGVFEQRQITLPIRRVQAVRYYETLLRQPIGYGTLYVEAVGHQEEKGEATVLHPFLSRAEAQALLAELLPQFDVPFDFVRPPKRALPRFLIKPSVFVAAPALIGTIWWTPASLLLLGLPAIWLVGYLSWRDTGLSLTNEIAVVRSRSSLRRTTAILLRETTQVATTRASVFQRRRDLASVSLTVATGPIGRTFTARDLAEGDAWRALGWVVTPPETLRGSSADSRSVQTQAT